MKKYVSKTLYVLLALFLIGCAPSYRYSILVSETIQEDSLKNESVIYESPNDDRVVFYSQNGKTRQIELMCPLYSSDFKYDSIVWYRNGVPYKGLKVEIDEDSKESKVFLLKKMDSSRVTFDKVTKIPVSKEFIESSTILFKIDLGGSFDRFDLYQDSTGIIEVRGKLPENVPLQSFNIGVYKRDSLKMIEIPHELGLAKKMKNCTPTVFAEFGGVKIPIEDHCPEMLAELDRDSFRVSFNVSWNADEIILYKNGEPFKTVKLAYKKEGEKIVELKAQTDAGENFYVSHSDDRKSWYVTEEP